jgi:hypothetical protein
MLANAPVIGSKFLLLRHVAGILDAFYQTSLHTGVVFTHTSRAQGREEDEDGDR